MQKRGRGVIPGSLFDLAQSFAQSFLPVSANSIKSKNPPSLAGQRASLSCCTTVDFCLHAKNQFTRVHDIKKSAERALLKFQVE